MSHSGKFDAAVGAAFAAIGLAWSIQVYRTIPAGAGGGDIGPRAFPLMLGILLVLLSGGWAIARLMSGAKREAANSNAVIDLDGGPGSRGTPLQLTGMVVVTLCLLMFYGWTMAGFGFAISTFVTILLSMFGILRERRPLVLIGMAFGVTFLVWLLFEVILGIPLANGRWFNLG